MSRDLDEKLNSLIPMVVEQTSKGKELTIFILDYLKKELFFWLVQLMI